MLEPLIMLTCIAAVFGVFMAAVIAEGVHKSRWNASQALLALYARYSAGIESFNAAMQRVSISADEAAANLARFASALGTSVDDIDIATLNPTDQRDGSTRQSTADSGRTTSTKDTTALAESDDEVQR